MARTSAEGMAETGAKGMAEMTTAGAARGVTIGITMLAAISGSSRVSAIRATDIQNEWRLQQKVRQIHIKGRRKKKAMTKGEGKT